MLAKLEAQKAPVSQPRVMVKPTKPAPDIETTTEPIVNPENIPGSVVPTQPSFSRFNI